MATQGPAPQPPAPKPKPRSRTTSPAAAVGLARFAIVAVLAVIVALLFAQSKYAIIFGKTSSYSHHVQVIVPSAFEVIPGERMVAGGETVGQITKAEVTKTGQAHIVMGITGGGWPIPTDSVLRLRMGGTIKYTDRFIEIDKGQSTDYYTNNAYVQPSRFIVPVEYNELFNIFNKQTRAGLQSMFANAGPALKQAAPAFHSALPLAPPVLSQATAVFKDLGYDQAALSALVTTGGQLSKAIATSNPGLRELLTGAANTFATTASSSQQIAQLIDVGTKANTDIGNILFHITKTLYPASALARQLEPAVTQLDQLTSPLNGTLRELVSVEPLAVHTLNTVVSQGPTINTLLSSARTKLLPQLTSVANQATTETSCLRPWTPDIMNVLDEFAGFQNGFNNPHVHMLHTLVSLHPYPNQLPFGTVQLNKLFPNMHVGEAPPGTGWNQPWYQPQCGSTPQSDSAAGDSENGTFDPSGSKLVPFTTTTPVFTPGPSPRPPVVNTP